MGLYERWKARGAEGRRIAALQAACDHDWKVIKAYYGQALFRHIKRECRKCGKVGFSPVGDGPPR